MIVETVTTTINPDGTVNCAAMGVEWGDEAIVIKPYRATRTLRNLEARGAAVVNLTDDILLFTRAALDDQHTPTRPAELVDGAVLADACSWREVAVDAIDATGPRARVTARVVGGGTGREFIGFSPASGAGLEGSIPAPRGPRPPAGAGSSPRAAGACRRRRSAPSSGASPWSWRRRPGPASARRGIASWRTCAPPSRTDDDGPRRGARAPAHGYARRLGSGHTALRRARRGGGRAGRGRRGHGRRRRAHRR